MERIYTLCLHDDREVITTTCVRSAPDTVVIPVIGGPDQRYMRVYCDGDDVHYVRERKY